MSPSLLLTATEQQARALRLAHNQAQKARGKKVWLAADIQSLERWTRSLWLNTWPEELLLSRNQETHLWESLVNRDQQAQELLAPRRLAQQLAQTWHSAQLWSIDWQAGPHWSREQYFFKRIAERFLTELEANNQITAAQIPARVCEQLKTQDLPLQIELYGLDNKDLPSAYRQVLEQLENKLGRLPRRPLPTQETQPQASACEDENQQWQLIADSLANILRQQPDSQIRLVVPQPEQRRSLIEEHFRRTLAPWRAAGPDINAPEPWYFEASARLIEQPAIHAACVALRPQHQRNKFESLSQFLLNPLLFNAQERQETAVIEKKLREYGLLLPAEAITRLCREAAPPELKNKLRRYVEALKLAPKQAPYRAWAEYFHSLWHALDYQTNGPDWPLGEEMDLAILEFSSLDLWGQTIPRSEALRWLELSLRNKRYSPRDAAMRPIHICDLGHAQGLPADHILIADLDHRYCPKPARLNPFLNPDAQIAAGIPESDANLSLHSARQQLEHIFQLAPQVQVYYSRSDAQGSELIASRALPLPWQEAESTASVPIENHYEFPEHDEVPELNSERLKQLSGGSNILKNQAYSPFFAFARHRLKLESMPNPLKGISPQAQGIWIHEVLEKFWLQTKTQQRLKQLDDAQLQTQLRNFVQAGAAKHLPRQRYGAQLQELEMARIIRSCVAWLKLEKQRPESFEVLYCEQKQEEQFNGLPMRLRMDRIDRVDTDNGPRILILDYKTSSHANKSAWHMPKMYEPQLPLYAISEQLEALGITQIDGLGFARVVEHKPEFACLLNWRQDLIKDRPMKAALEWNEQLQQWRADLHTLASDFCQGGTGIRQGEDFSRALAINDLLLLVDQAEGDGDE